MTSAVRVVGAILAALALAADWPQFRGPNGAASTDDNNWPATWNEKENLRWMADLPGPGSSSPIVHGERVFLTCYTDYGVDAKSVGNLDELKRLLVCFDRRDGKQVWQTSVSSAAKDDAYRGFITEHGYASNTPVTDGERVYCFFGKTGAAAFDYATGKKLWQTSCGTSSSDRKWGSAASPVLFKNLVIINASDEDRALYGLDKVTGKQVWRSEASSLTLAFGTPVIAEVNGAAEMILAVPGEIWGINPETGKTLWHCDAPMTGNVSPSVVVDGGVAYAFGGFLSRGSAAVKLGGRDAVTESHRLWKSKLTSYVPSPVVFGEHVYWVNDKGMAYCSKAATGEQVYQERLPMRGGAGASGPVYASMVRAGDRLIAVSRRQGAFVIAASPEFKLLAHNRIEGDETDFNGSPAVCDGRVFLRSNKGLYCFGK